METEIGNTTKTRGGARQTEVKVGFRLTQREVALLEFVLDQKFASIDALYPRFYAVGESDSTRYAAERLQLLRRHGFLEATRVYTSPKLFYLASPLARDVLQAQRPDRRLLDPISSIDFRTFEHDWRVTLCRVAREKSGHARDWVSERRLKAEWARYSGVLAREYCPDGIYTNRRGEQVAFELELAPKTRERMSRKVTKFLDAMRHGSASGPFQRALFVACSPQVQKQIEGLVAPYPDQFRVMASAELVDGTTRHQQQTEESVKPIG